jgi:hypothetical protein
VPPHAKQGAARRAAPEIFAGNRRFCDFPIVKAMQLNCAPPIRLVHFA